MGCVIYTIGHSNHSSERFLELLAPHPVDTVVDVRSAPASRFCPQFNKKALERWLPERGLRYLFLGQELGARRAEPECWVDDAVSYPRVAEAPAFLAGLSQLRAGMVLMCAERDPLTCHRAVLITRELGNRFGVPAVHVREDGRTETGEELEERLLAREPHLLADRTRLLEEAYRRQGERIAYRRSKV